MGRISTLTIDLDADGRREERALRKSQTTWKRYSRDVGRSLNGIAKAARLGSAAIGAGAVVAARAATNLADETAKAARNAGISSRRFQELRHAFNEAGASGDTLVRASTTLARRMGELEIGTATAVRAFGALDIAFEDIRDQSPDAVLTLVIDRLKGIDDPARRAATAAEIFGGAAKTMGSLIDGGADALRDAADEAQKFGLVLSEDALGAAEDFNDQIGLLEQALKTNFAQGLLEAAGSTEDLDDAIEEAAAAARAFGGFLVTFATTLSNHRDTIVAIGAATVLRIAVTIAVPASTPR